MQRDSQLALQPLRRGTHAAAAPRAGRCAAERGPRGPKEAIRCQLIGEYLSRLLLKRFRNARPTGRAFQCRL